MCLHISVCMHIYLYIYVYGVYTETDIYIIVSNLKDLSLLLRIYQNRVGVVYVDDPRMAECR